MIPLLEPFFQGNLAPFGERLVCTQYTPLPPDAVALRTLLNRDFLQALIERQARMRAVTGCDLRAPASLWSLEYVAALMPPVVVGAALLDQIFPMGIDDVHVRLDENGNLLTFHIAHLVASTVDRNTSPQTRYATLLEEHLAALFDALSQLSRVAPKILWGNAARAFDMVFEHACALSDSQTLRRDRDFLLHSTQWDGRDNPMWGRQRQASHVHGTHVHRITLHRQCCLHHLLPGKEYCGACPLSPANRCTRADPVS